jgi:hypothetical protein
MPDDILQQSYLAQLAAAQLNDAQQQKAQETLSQIAGIMSDCREAAKHIRADGRLTEAGQAADIARLASETDSRLAAIGDDRIKRLDARIAELAHLIRPQDQASDLVLELMKQQEVRQLLTGMDELELTAMYQEAAIDGSNDLLIRSIESAPLQLIHDQTVLESGKRARGQRQSPESATILRQLQRVRSIIQGEVNAARSELNLPDLTVQNVAQGTAA